MLKIFLFMMGLFIKFVGLRRILKAEIFGWWKLREVKRREKEVKILSIMKFSLIKLTKFMNDTLNLSPWLGRQVSYKIPDSTRPKRHFSQNREKLKFKSFLN